ncbi:MAG: glycosyl transferase, partial [Candidatus Saccharibacteria bacterium]|nr:glycosyl transferase [Candidatus Saccharibacteria bacterium]
MTKQSDVRLSVVVPVHNESAGLERFHQSLLDVLPGASKDSYEIIYVEDGSTDDTAEIIRSWAAKDDSIKLVKLSRNFGKEIATTAGIHAARGQAIITIDADGQHPPELISQFVSKWRAGSKVVVGIRTSNHKEGLVKRYGSKLFYGLFNRLTGMKLVPSSTDFRLIDRAVQTEFVRMTERNRITRGLIDWLGYKRDFVEFRANPRLAGDAGYSFKKLFKLAIDSMVSLSISPLYITAYIGAIILPVSTLLGLFMVVDALARDPLHLHATGSAYVMVLI